MRNAVWALTAFGTICALNAAPAVAQNFPYCIKGCESGSGLGDCSFATYQQCQATASGRSAYCAANPYFSQNAELQTNQSSRRRH